MLFPLGCVTARKLLPLPPGLNLTKAPSPSGSGEKEEGFAEVNDIDPGSISSSIRGSAFPRVVSAEETTEGICVKRQLTICVTQPRRIAAVALSRRVGEELGAPELVGYQVSNELSKLKGFLL